MKEKDWREEFKELCERKISGYTGIGTSSGDGCIEIADPPSYDECVEFITEIEQQAYERGYKDGLVEGQQKIEYLTNKEGVE